MYLFSDWFQLASPPLSQKAAEKVINRELRESEHEPLARNRTGTIFLEYNHRGANQLSACTFSAASRKGEGRLAVTNR